MSEEPESTAVYRVWGESDLLLYNIFEPDQVEMCRQACRNLLSASVTGDEARQLITSAASSLRERRGSLDRRRGSRGSQAGEPTALNHHGPIWTI
jgi:hypothetical protein